MTDRYRVYKVLQTLKRQLKMHRQGHVVTLAMMITGIVMSHKAQLAVMSGEVPTDAKKYRDAYAALGQAREDRGRSGVHAVCAADIGSVGECAPGFGDGWEHYRAWLYGADGRSHLSQAGIASGLGGLQRQERACSGGSARESAAESGAAHPRGGRSGLVGRWGV